jgi:hypothetical protein
VAITDVPIALGNPEKKIKNYKLNFLNGLNSKYLLD